MSLDLDLLRLMKERKEFDKLSAVAPKEGLGGCTMRVARGIAAFYKEFDKVQHIDVHTFKTWFMEFHASNENEDVKGLCGAMIDDMQRDVPLEMREGMVKRLLDADYAAKLSDVLLRWDDGGEFDIFDAINMVAEEFIERSDRQTKLPEVLETPEELVQRDEDDKGLSFRLAAINRSFRRVKPGQFGIIAARPDRGKTTTMCSESSHWVTQLDEVWPGENRCGVWFNNEGDGKEIKHRFYQAVLGVDHETMVKYLRDGSLRKRIEDSMGGLERMRFFDIHDMTSSQVESIIKTINPGFIIYDMIDNIRFDGALTNGGTRTDQMLEEMYKWGRNRCVKHGAIGFAVSQLSGDAEGIDYPNQSMLKDSKTGKQGACDFIITIGALNDPGMDGYRYIGATKNKLHRKGAPKSPRAQVIFDPHIARLTDPKE